MDWGGGSYIGLAHTVCRVTQAMQPPDKHHNRASWCACSDCTFTPALVATHSTCVTGRYICTTAHTVHAPINSVLGPEEAHLVGAVAHDGRGGPCPQPQQPLLLCNCYCTVDGALHSHNLSDLIQLHMPLYYFTYFDAGHGSTSHHQ